MCLVLAVKPNGFSPVPVFVSKLDNIAEFNYDPSSDVIFDTWFRRYEDMFDVEFDHEVSWKVRIL